jgi:hypothetical protein
LLIEAKRVIKRIKYMLPVPSQIQLKMQLK